MVDIRDLKSRGQLNSRAGSSPAPGTKTVRSNACHWAFTVLPGAGRESEGGHPFSKTGRTSRAEKFLRATATKNVLGRDAPAHLKKRNSVLV
jgi:hypothetical protein